MTTVSSLTDAQRADLYAQVGDAMNAVGFNYDAHISANTQNGVFVAPVNNPPAVAGGAPAVGAPVIVPPMQTTLASASALLDLTAAQREDLYKQVGDAMYATGFNYAAHIAGNTKNGVFVAPVYIPTNTSSILALPDKTSAEYAKLYQEVGAALNSATFNYAAHVAALTSQSRKDLSYDDVLRLITETKQTDFTNFDLQAYRLKSGSTVGLNNDYSNPVFAQVATNFLESKTLLTKPAPGSAEYTRLSLETGGASEKVEFDYVAHVAAITSQKIMPSLSYAEVVALIAETGKSNFENFDLAAYKIEKTKADVLLSRFESALSSAPVTAPKAGTPEYQKLLAQTGLSSLDNFDYKSYLSTLDKAESNAKKLIGTEGDDVLSETAGAAKDLLAGGGGNDRITAGTGNDYLIGGSGNDQLNGGTGIDTALYEAKKASVSVSRDASGTWVVTDKTQQEGVDQLQGVERLSFADSSLALDLDGAAGQAYRIYKAAFDRDPMKGDLTGIGYWISKVDDGMSLVEVSARFINSDEFRASYGTNPTDADILTKVYRNVLDREPDQEGYNWWLGQLKTDPEKTWQKVLADFSESKENKVNVAELIGNGVEYTTWVG